MPLKTNCPSCGKVLNIPDSAAGKRAKCPACAHVWQIPDAAGGGQPAGGIAQPAGSTTNCPGCGRVIQLPAEAAGKRVKCPACAHVWQIPGGVLDAEAVPMAPAAGSSFDDMMSDSYPLAAPSAPSLGGSASGPGGDQPRRPCPQCGEMIVIGAAKCRFCDAVFDATLRRTEKKKRGSASDENLTPTEWILCAICPGPVCIAGLVYLVLGKPKALKMIGASLLFGFLWNVVGFIIQAAQHAH
jgi:predicted RNA-binding Zn-ribbon protein involved in translation (DUF1610 family)